MKRLGIIGGTFDPIHKGHLALAKAAAEEFVLDEIIFIPSGHPPHKKKHKVTNREDRFNMVKLAIKGKKSFKVSRMEIDRQGVCYAVDTFNELKKKHGKKAKLFYIMGLDSINEILEWKKPLELFKLCEFIVGTRPGTKPRAFSKTDKIHLMELKEDVSSSNIRKSLGAGKSAKGFLPKAVETYIKRNKLYDNPKR